MKPEKLASQALGNPRSLRINKTEDDEIVALHKEVGDKTGFAVVDIIRMSVRAGWPDVKRQLEGFKK